MILFIAHTDSYYAFQPKIERLYVISTSLSNNTCSTFENE